MPSPSVVRARYAPHTDWTTPPRRLRPVCGSGIITPRHALHDATLRPLAAIAISAGYPTSVTEAPNYEDHLGLIDEVIDLICWRNRLSGAEADDFRQEAHLKLLEGRIVEKHEGRSSLRTYLTTVLQRIYLDYRVKQWGKWRPSVEAKRNGALAILLERLILREGLSFEEALETLKTNYGVPESRAHLEKLASRLPLRIIRKAKGEEALTSIPDGAPPADAQLAREQVKTRIEAVREALGRALADIDPFDRMVLTLRYWNGVSVVSIAKRTGQDHKRLFRRLEKVKEQLRKILIAAGIDPKGLFDDDDPWDE
jgi:RNA polymerase sigma factor (sigma-70 family)